MIAHAINNDTFQNKTAEKVLATLDSANKSVTSFLKKTRGVETKKRYNEVRKQITRIADGLRNEVESDIDVDNFLQQELDSLSKIYSKTSFPEKMNIPTLSQVKEASTFIPYADNKNFDSFLKNINEQFFNIWDSAVRTGYMTGMSSNEIVRNVIGSVAKNAQVAKTGSIETLRKSLIANTKTALQSFATETRNQVYKKNEEFISGYKWLSTLDRRTCLVCGSYDGKIFKHLDDIKDMPPLHLNCRCVIVPVIDEMDFDDTRSAEGGEVDSKVTYKDWFDNQNEDVKKEILGKVRYELYKNNDYQIKDFVGQTRVIPLNLPVAKYYSEDSYVKDNIDLFENGEKYSTNKFDEKRFRTCKPESLDESYKKVNPNFRKKNNYEYKENCQRVVIANELRIRGYDVIALPCYNVGSDYLAYHLEEVFNGNDLVISNIPNYEKMVKIIEENGSIYSRYICCYSYENSDGRIRRHAINLEKKFLNLKQEITYFDGQILNRFTKFDNPDNLKNIKLIRTDIADVNKLAEFAVTSRRG